MVAAVGALECAFVLVVEAIAVAAVLLAFLETVAVSLIVGSAPRIVVDTCASSAPCASPQTTAAATPLSGRTLTRERAGLRPRAVDKTSEHGSMPSPPQGQEPRLARVQEFS